MRFLAATHRDLNALVAEGSFRSDLYYRLNGAELRVPGLDERLEDIPLLIEHFLARLAERHGRAKEISGELVERLVARPWPGHVRELRNEVDRLYFLSNDRIEDADLLDGHARARAPEPPGELGLRLEDAERWAVQRALEAGGSKLEAARILGISRGGLYLKLKRFGLLD